MGDGDGNGEPPDSGDSARAGAPTGRGALRACGAPDPGAPLAPPPEVRLVREFKGPTVRGVLDLPDEAVDRMPAQLRRVLDAIQRGRVAEADDAMDGALGALHAGPGHRRRAGRTLTRSLLVGLCGFVVSWILLRLLAPGLVP